MASLKRFFDLFLLISDVYQLSHPRGMNGVHDKFRGPHRLARALTTNASLAHFNYILEEGKGDETQSA